MQAGSYLGNVLGCALGAALLLASGVVPQLLPGVTATALSKLSYPLQQVPTSGGGEAGVAAFPHCWPAGWKGLMGLRWRCRLAARGLSSGGLQMPILGRLLRPPPAPADLHQGCAGQLAGLPGGVAGHSGAVGGR